MAILWSNNASSTVSGSITATATSVALAAGTGVKFPSPTGGDYFIATFYDQATKTQNEIVHVTARVGDVCTIVRAQEGTVAQAWSAADIFANLVTAGTLEAFVQAGTGPADTSVVYVGLDTSTNPNLIVATTNPVPPAYGIGMLFNIRKNNIAGSTSNSAPTMMQLNGVAPLNVTRTDGSSMIGGELFNGEEMTYLYNEGDPVTHANPHFVALVPPSKRQLPPGFTFYVRTDGNDNNTGLANTPQDAFRTVSGGMYHVRQNYTSLGVVNMRVADGYYYDGFGPSDSYIAQWNIIGNQTNPAACTIDATRTNAASYDNPATAWVGACANSAGTGNMTVSGFTFRSFFGNVGSVNGGQLTVTGCEFTAPLTGMPPIQGGAGGNVGVYNTYNAAHTAVIRGCGYAAETRAVTALFSAWTSGNVGLGYQDQLSTTTLTMTLHDIPTFTQAFAIAYAGGEIGVFAPVWSVNGPGFIPGSSPSAPQYAVSSGGGIFFVGGGPADVFPGVLPGTVASPGWVV